MQPFSKIGPMPKKAAPTKGFCIAREATGRDAAKCTAERLGAEVAATYGPRDEAAFVLAARDESGGWIGGINGVIHWRWLYIGQFYLAPGRRGQGIGRALLAEAEIFARENHCVGIYLDTFDAGALAFYRKCGFEIAGRIDNFPPGAVRTYLSLSLT
jgi:GNAT superfamily N-acetyltransferase